MAARPPFTQARNSIGPTYDFWENKFLNFFVGAVVLVSISPQIQELRFWKKNYLTILKAGRVIHKFLKSFLHLLRRTKRGTRSVGFFAKGPLPEVLVGPGFFSKCSIFSQNFSKCSIFSQNLHVAKERANTKVKGGMPKKMKFSQNFSKCSIFFSKCHFFSKCSICSQNVPHYFLKFFPLFSQILPLFSQILPFFSQILQFFLKMFQLFLKTFSFQINTKKIQNILG